MKLVKGRDLRILDFDIENRPLSYLGPDFTTTDITAIATAWVGSNKVDVWVQTKDDRSRKTMLRNFVERYNDADIVTGHYILRHDLPIINGALIDEGLPPLGPKMVSDTKVHLIGFAGISKSQENLGGAFGLKAPKVQMNTPAWRLANRLTRDGTMLSASRVRGDVIQHMELRRILIGRHLLKPPTMWPSRY